MTAAEGLDPDLVDFLLGLPVVNPPQPVDDLKQRRSLRLSDGVDIEHATLGSTSHDIDEPAAPRHTRWDAESSDVRGPFGVGGHSNSPSLHGRLTRYAAAALLLALRQLQRMRVVRRAAVDAPRPSDTEAST